MMPISSDVQWITTCIKKARTKEISVTDTVSIEIAKLLNGRLSEHQLTETQLTNLAKLLLKHMVPSAPGKEANG